VLRALSRSRTIAAVRSFFPSAAAPARRPIDGTGELDPVVRQFRFTLVGDARAAESTTRDTQPDPSGVRRDSAGRKEVTMTSDDMTSKTKAAAVNQADMKLEAVVIGITDVDRAKAFYEKLCWRLDAHGCGDRENL
jgi:hypothetical protein